MDIINQRVLNFIGLSGSAETQNNGKNSFQTILIIIQLTTNFMATFHGLYLLDVKSHSFRFLFPLFPLWVEHVEKGLRTISNKRRKPIGKKKDIT